MAQITAAIVKELRERTGAGMMDCKKALVATEGDMEKAIDFLREKGLSQAAKKAGRVAAEGAVVAYVTEDGKTGAIVEVNCETDFVGKNENFQALAKSIAELIVKTNPADVDALLASEMDGKTVKDVVTEAIAKIGENISVRRFVRYESAEGKVYSYIHGGGKIGVLVDMKGGDAELGKDIAMQVAAANPQFLNRNEVPDSELEHEKDILTEQARNEGKPENIIAKMVMGRINKYYKEVCLVDQEFIRDGDLTISKLLKSKNADVARFARFQLGEGIEKKQENFADEVAAFIKK
ncbi:MAG: elongation factor Ts [Acidaminococcaceae bacterium]|jgi:elongation factor Ts|uniref:Elongation factor Ts n=1 Tax=Succiniclasticum ruminis TaxID=40841 RepID=A0A1G6N4P7_9FIRM|nr:translation elongation factor Ts [Succiniclasticum ruminis]MBQ1776987.1 elongation factor Ts [Acidaminococcaceae bacterium]MEE3395924.1 translation elongation factor Ts [Succiniclasticum sp.]MBQ2141133.1 elongation factor Ts [Acidaminococcaceae bacterium]MBQ2220330.1 elongation factor Ts [Acidaminococcaceae bacterium]MBQ2343858.1 elongation factor Ts [Acidaminococcaceae bacterium]